MKISVFGLGYVGSVTSACLAEQGFQVIGVDVNQNKADTINRGEPPVLETGLAELVERNVQRNQLTATTEVADAINQTDVSIVCVGTPSQTNGNLDLQYVSRVAEQIGSALSTKKDYHTIILRSTMLPGSTWDNIRPILEKHSGKRVNIDFGLCFNPEFLREGSAIADFRDPPFTILGVESDIVADKVQGLYSWLDAELLVVGTRVAETIKYINNCYHALKVSFANEVGRLCKALEIDSHTVMDIFCKDTKQNLSSYYLKPGYAFGGSCLPKDLRAIMYLANSLHLPMEVFGSILPSNKTQIDLGVQLVEQAGSKNVGLLGLSFKAGTDDLRESPLVTLVETLSGRGYQVRIFDDQVALSRLVGANKAYIEQQLPHIGAMLHDQVDDVVTPSDTIVVGNSNTLFADIVSQLSSEKRVLDLTRILKEPSPKTANYHGISW